MAVPCMTTVLPDHCDQDFLTLWIPLLSLLTKYKALGAGVMGNSALYEVVSLALLSFWFSIVQEWLF